MQISESVKMAMSSIAANRLRASLTLLSISIGVFAIVGVAAAVGALDNSVQNQLDALGRSSFIIQRDPAMTFGGRGDRQRKNITLRQAQELKRRLTNAEDVSLTNFTMGAVLKHEGKSTDPKMFVVGGDESFAANSDYSIDLGRSISAEDVRSGSDVVVLGADAVSILFNRVSPVGKVVSINGHRYVVVGTFASKGAVFGMSQDDRMLVPITSAAKYFFDEWGTSIAINIRTASVAAMEVVQSQAIGLMRSIRRVELGEPNDFEVITNESLSDTFGSFTEYIGLFGLGCGAIALLAAGVGIMNIMLVSVKERTREIGIRKAVGATRADILSQFVIEAITLCQLGAFIGIGLGVLGGVALGAALKSDPVIPWGWVVIALTTCTFIGLIFGIYPAWKASRLDPIDALRYE